MIAAQAHTVPNATGDTVGDTQGTPKKGQSLSLCIVGALQAEPDFDFTILDVCDRTGIPYATVKRTLNRLSSTGKGSGKARSVGHGLYRYAPEKGDNSLQDLARSGNWKLENICLIKSVPFGVYPTPVSPNNAAPDQEKGTPSNPCIPSSLPGYPWHLPTGQLVTWDRYENGTEMIRLSANGAPPFSPDHILTLIALFRRAGLNPVEWMCTSLEINVDSQRIRIDASYSVQEIEGLLIKVYQSGYNARIEIANRQPTPMPVVMDFIQGIYKGIEAREARKEVRALKQELHEIGATANRAYNVAAKAMDKAYDRKQTITPAKPTERQHGGFTTASQLQR